MSKQPYHKTIPPATGQIYGMIHAGSMNLKLAIAELIANSIDQHPQNININFDRKAKAFIISDDGNGCHDLEKMVEIGTHVPSKENPIGRYGVGFKDAVIWLGDSVIVDSMTKGGKKQSVGADWQNMMALHFWDFEFVHDSTRERPGVTISVRDLRGRRFKAWNEVPKYIAELFSAAIDSGIDITVDGVIVKSNPQPLLANMVQFKGSFSGLNFEGFAGLLVDKKSAPSGWEIRYGPQTIQLGYLKEGFGDYSPQGFYGRFNMISGTRKWTITRNKTDSEDLYDVLNCEYVQSIIRPLLELIKNQAAIVKIQINQADTEFCLTNLLQKAKARIIEEEEEVDGGTGPAPGPGLGGSEKRKKRKKRVYDPLSEVKEKIKQATVVKIWPHQDITNKGFCFISPSNKNTLLTVYVDNSTAMGQWIWQNKSLLKQHGVMCLAVYFGLQVNILGQLRLPIGDLGAENETRISRALLYLLEHMDMDETGNATIAA